MGGLATAGPELAALMSFRPGFEFERTAAELASERVSWARDDRAFFAAGACHVLAYAFVDRFPDFHIMFIKPWQGFGGTHVFASNGSVSFDHNGLMPVEEFLLKSAMAYQARYPGWFSDLVPVTGSIRQFCAENDHTLPELFHRLPWDRADACIDRMLFQAAVSALRGSSP